MSRCSLGHWGPGGFGSLAEVRQLFERPGLLAAGWLHYLAFDLFVGTWIARDAAQARSAALGRAALPGADLHVRPGRPAGLCRDGFHSPQAGPMNPLSLTHTLPGAARPGPTPWAALWQREPRLVAFALLMLALMLPAAIGLGLDERMLRGVNVWVKPMKFMASVALLALTTAWFARSCRPPCARAAASACWCGPDRQRRLRGRLHHAAGGTGRGLALQRRRPAARGCCTR